MKTNNPKILTIADHELLSQAYTNLIDAGLLIATVEYEEFLEAVV